MCALGFHSKFQKLPVHYCKINDKAKKVREGNLICLDNDFTIEAIKYASLVFSKACARSLFFQSQSVGEKPRQVND